ncbi:MAG: hypothetical protein L6Q76_29705 [Polyangiaceae bacterium]|nr:hypothetical protein [Polyangiaceae bacterium]
MASISLNPAFQDRVMFQTEQSFRHDHKVNVLKGAIVALAIVGIGVSTLALPAVGPASDEAEQLAAERSDSELYPTE